jgi:hypothetical protein
MVHNIPLAITSTLRCRRIQSIRSQHGYSPLYTRINTCSHKIHLHSVQRRYYMKKGTFYKLTYRYLGDRSLLAPTILLMDDDGILIMLAFFICALHFDFSLQGVFIYGHFRSADRTGFFFHGDHALDLHDILIINSYLHIQEMGSFPHLHFSASIPFAFL